MYTQVPSVDAEGLENHGVGKGLSWRRTFMTSLIFTGLVTSGALLFSGTWSDKEISTSNLNDELVGLSPAALAAKKSVKYGELSNAEVEALFDDFIKQYKKPYATNLEEKASRFLTFKSNLADIDKYNKQNPHALFAITNRADWTTDERSHVRGLASASMAKMDSSKTSWQYMKEAYPDQEAIALGSRGQGAVSAATKESRLGESLDTIDGTKMSTGSLGWLDGSDCQACKMYETFSHYTMDNLPENFDWRALGAVSAVTNQKYCGSCWSFSTAQDIEGTHFLATGELIPLSEQQQVACNVECDGCDGGWPFRAMQYARKIGGMLYSENYPYKGICAWDACDKRPDDADSRTPVCDVLLLDEKIEAKNVSAIKGYQMVAMGADYEEFLRLALVKNGPLSMAFNAVSMDYYELGVTGCSDDSVEHAGCISAYETCDPEYLDHAVLITGYGTENGIPYWVIKNSWSQEWGEKGYFRMIRGVNHCGLANFVVHSVAEA